MNKPKPQHVFDFVASVSVCGDPTPTTKQNLFSTICTMGLALGTQRAMLLLVGTNRRTKEPRP